MLQPQPSPATHESAFIERYERLRKSALILTNQNQEQAEDLLHDAFVQFLLSHPDLQSIQNLDGYLYRVLRNMRVSQMRRATRLQEATLTMAGSPLENILSLPDHSSLENGLNSIEQRAQQQVQDELRRICQYAVARKGSSKAGSIVMLRFFLGYYPEEIAQILKSPRATIDKALQRARGEARLYLAEPDSLSFIRSNPESETLGEVEPGKTLSEFLQNLRAAVYASEHDACWSVKTIRGWYTIKPSATSSGPDTKALSHAVGCPKCLDEINRTLSLPLLATRHPAEMGRRDPRKPRKGGKDGGASGGASGGGVRESFLDRSRKRLKEAFEHRPQELRICVNGFLLGSQRINAELNEQTLSIKGEDKVGFVEVFSEREVRLLFYCVESPPDGPVEHHQLVNLSSGRSLELSLDFSAQSPNLEVLYRDPTLAGEEIAEAEEIHSAEAPVAGRADSRPSLLTDLKLQSASLIKRLLSGSFWLRPATVTTLCALLLLGALTLLYRHAPEPPVAAADILQRSTQAEEAIAAIPATVLHRTLQLEERASSGDLIARHRIESWQSGERGVIARRLYDEKNTLIAGDWRRNDGVQTLYHHGSQPRLQIRKAGPPDGQPGWGASSQSGINSFQDVWQQSLSAKDFVALIGGTDRARVEEDQDTYAIRYEGGQGNTTGLRRAALILRRNDLHPVEETLTVGEGRELREYRIAEIVFERRPASGVDPSVFEPEPQLLSSAKGETPTSKPEAASVSPSALTPSPVTATPELEVEVLGLLHQAGADLGEQVTVTRTREGQLRVEGLVDTDVRKGQLLRALDSVRSNPAVRIEINTVAEALKRQSAAKSSPESISIERQEGARSITADAELRRYFSSKGVAAGQVDQEVTRFANRIVNRSLQVMTHAWAIKRLAERFSPEQLSTLAPDARAKWLAIVRAHAQSVRQETASLRQELQPVFPASSIQGGEEKIEISSDADLLRAIERLFEVCAANDRIVSSAFAIKSQTGNASDLQGPQFSRSLRRAEQLAAVISKQ